MNRFLWGSLVFLLLVLRLQPGAADEPEAYPWPGGARAAVSLSYDDALDSQLDNAIPALNRYGFRASFYLTLSAESVRHRLDDWRAAAQAGHELGNHSLFHPCSGSKPGREWVPDWNDLDGIGVAELTARLRLANSMLYAIDGRTERTFTTPCGDLEAAGEDYLEAVKDQFLAAKARFGGVTESMQSLDPFRVSVAAPSDVSGAELIALVEDAARRGTMANLTFHGVGGDYLAVSTEAHEQLLRHLADHPETYWVDSFRNIMRFVRTRFDSD